MQRNPYASPNAKVASERPSAPLEWQRAKWVFGGLWLLLTVLPVLNAVLEPPSTPDWGILLANSIAAVAAAAFVGRDMWMLKVRRSPLIVDIAIYAIVLGGLAFLIIVKEAGIYVWNDLHLNIPIFLVMGILAITAWFTESTKRVRIYIGARQLVFMEA